jgi:hypothetical protein
MAYIGRDPLYGLFEKQVVSANGSTTLFTLDFLVGSASSILVVDDGAVVQPGVGYTIADGGTKIQFTTAPAGVVYLIYLGKQLLVPAYNKTILTQDLSGNITLTTSDIRDIISVNPLVSNRTIFIPVAIDALGYQTTIRNRSSSLSVVINAGSTVATITPNSSVTIASDGIGWFIVL